VSKGIIDLLGEAEEAARRMERRSGVSGAANELRLADHRNVLTHQQVIAGNVRIALSRLAASAERAYKQKIITDPPASTAVRQLTSACGDLKTAVSGCAAAAQLVGTAAQADTSPAVRGRTSYLLVTSDKCSAATNALAEGPAWPVPGSSAQFWAGVCGYFERMLNAMAAVLGNEAVIVGRAFTERAGLDGGTACEAMRSAAGEIKLSVTRVRAAGADLGRSAPPDEAKPFAVNGLRGFGN
jgi:hypothetical protein